MDEYQIIDLLVTAGVASMFAAPGFAFLAVLGWRAAHDARMAFERECEEHDFTRRRLTDVEALRAWEAPKGEPMRCGTIATGSDCARELGHDGLCAAMPDNGAYTWVDEYGRERG